MSSAHTTKKLLPRYSGCCFCGSISIYMTSCVQQAAVHSRHMHLSQQRLARYQFLGTLFETTHAGLWTSTAVICRRLGVWSLKCQSKTTDSGQQLSVRGRYSVLESHVIEQIRVAVAEIVKANTLFMNAIVYGTDCTCTSSQPRDS